MKKIIIFFLTLIIATVIYFQSRSQDKTEAISLTNAASTSVKESKSSSRPSLQNQVSRGDSSLSSAHSFSISEAKQVAINDKKLEVSSDFEKTNSRKIENPINKLATLLPDALAAEGFPPEIGTCITKNADENLKTKPPLSFDEIADKCADLHGLTGDSKLAIRKIFRDSIKNSMSLVNIDKWYKCASVRTLKGTKCLNEHYQSLLNDFYYEHRNNSQLIESEFAKKWQNMVNINMEKLIEQCPNLPVSLIEVYAYECNP
jgi:hypothetical protein